MELFIRTVENNTNKGNQVVMVHFIVQHDQITHNIIIIVWTGP